MIQNDRELIQETKRYFGKDRELLKNTLKSFKFDGERYRYWRLFFKKFDKRKIDINSRIFRDFANYLINKEYEKIDWESIGDLSWDVDFILNEEVNSHFDFDKKLAKICKGNTIRYLNIYISRIIPAYTICTFFKYYKDNIYEFGPLKLNHKEKQLIKNIKLEFRKLGYYYVKKSVALRKYRNLRTDINSEGNAMIFDCLFNDLDNYYDDYFRCNDKDIVDSNGRKTLWREYYNSNRRLIKREDSRWFKSGDLEQVITDGKGQIVEINVFPKKDKPRSIELNVEKIKKKYSSKFSVHLPY